VGVNSPSFGCTTIPTRSSSELRFQVLSATKPSFEVRFPSQHLGDLIGEEPGHNAGGRFSRNTREGIGSVLKGQHRWEHQDVFSSLVRFPTLSVMSHRSWWTGERQVPTILAWDSQEGRGTSRRPEVRWRCPVHALAGPAGRDWPSGLYQDRPPDQHAGGTR
jgi:hypothetical protein